MTIVRIILLLTTLTLYGCFSNIDSELIKSKESIKPNSDCHEITNSYSNCKAEVEFISNLGDIPIRIEDQPLTGQVAYLNPGKSNVVVINRPKRNRQAVEKVGNIITLIPAIVGMIIVRGNPIPGTVPSDRSRDPGSMCTAISFFINLEAGKKYTLNIDWTDSYVAVTMKNKTDDIMENIPSICDHEAK